MSDSLFDDKPFAVKEPVDPKLGVDAQRTLRRKALLAKGIHPTTKLPLRSGDETCKTCAHAFKNYKFWKCDEVVTTGGPATDIRLSWPACARWEPATPTEAPASPASEPTSGTA